MINQVYDRDIDAVMVRTQQRPLVTGSISAAHALRFGILLSVASVALLALTVNVLSAALAAAAIGFYVFIYTMLLKRRTAQNIVWGGAAGCFPVLIGWSAVTGSLALDALRPLRDRLLLDPAALLAAGAALQGRLPGGPGPDAARGRRQRLRGHGHRALLVGDGRHLPAADPGGRA